MCTIERVVRSHLLILNFPTIKIQWMRWNSNYFRRMLVCRIPIKPRDFQSANNSLSGQRVPRGYFFNGREHITMPGSGAERDHFCTMYVQWTPTASSQAENIKKVCKFIFYYSFSVSLTSSLCDRACSPRASGGCTLIYFASHVPSLFLLGDFALDLQQQQRRRRTLKTK